MRCCTFHEGDHDGDEHDDAMLQFSGEIVYFSAATAVVFDFQVSDMLALKLRCPELTSCMMEQNNVQRFFHHDDDITACALLVR